MDEMNMATARSADLLAVLRDCSLSQVDAEDVISVSDAAACPGGGLVLAGQDALTKGADLLRTGFSAPVLVDRRRYAGKKRPRGTARFQPQWIWAQQHLGLPAILTDSGYIDDNDVVALESVLTQTAQLDPRAVAMLPLHCSWIERKSSQERLIAAIADAGVPVALVLEHSTDPLAKKASLFGFVKVLRAVQVPTMVLSCDVSALGAMAFGAHTVAIGTRSGLRHLYPPTSGGPPPDDMESAFLPAFLAFMKVGKIAQAVAASPEDPKWTCWCQSCRGQSLDWLLAATRLEVRRHSIELLADLRDELTRNAPGPAREQAWRARCASAQFEHESLAAHRIYWNAPSAIRRWQEIQTT
jgi:hypothetical protein